jgi:hypothetical protein
MVRLIFRQAALVGPFAAIARSILNDTLCKGKSGGTDFVETTEAPLKFLLVAALRHAHHDPPR